MTFDEKTRQRLLKMNDAELSNLVSEIASAAGADPLKTAVIKNNLSHLRSTLQNMTSSDAEKLLQSIDKNKASEISRLIDGV